MNDDVALLNESEQALSLDDEDFVDGNYPVIALRDVVMFPGVVAPLFVGRVTSIEALEYAIEDKHNVLMLVSQKDAEEDDPNFSGLYSMGCLGVVLQMLKMPDKTVKVLIEGRVRASIATGLKDEPFLMAQVKVEPSLPIEGNHHVEASMRSMLMQFEQFLSLNKKLPAEIISAVNGIDDIGKLVDAIASHTQLKQGDKQRILEELNPIKRADLLMNMLENEVNMLLIERKIHNRVKQQMDNTQLKYFLNEKMTALQEELRDIEGESPSDIEAFEKKIMTLGLSEEAREKASSELDKLKMMSPMSSEATVIRHYLDWLLGLPWSSRSKVNKNIEKAQVVLDKDHYGLDKVKERILEYLAVEKRSKKLRGPILCLVGPPGVGKTSLGASIAKATNREFVRLSLGGVRDEAEIRGHRKTYIGAMPGKIIQKLVRCKRSNPLFMLDEIDKMGMDYRGDPASAMLEVLDPSQNHQFNDHYLEVDFDLSDIMFIATANSMNIPHALLDRMEIIFLGGYTEREKLMIARNYLISKQIQENGLKAKELTFSAGALLNIIRHYTHEAGVRELDRCLGKIARKVVRKLVTGKRTKPVYHITSSSLVQYLGVPRYHYGIADKSDRIGQVYGLAWTESGGDLLTLESVVMPGKGNLHHTGSLGEVMQESIQAAMTVVKSRSSQLGLEGFDFDAHDIHVHAPEGATPKDGPSAGIGMCVALASALAKVPVKSSVAMTGEITLCGEVLPIGGLKEKLLAAVRGGIKQVIIPEKNRKDLKDIPKEVATHLMITPVKWVDEVFAHALAEWPIKAKPNPGNDVVIPTSQSVEVAEEQRSH